MFYHYFRFIYYFLHYGPAKLDPYERKLKSGKNIAFTWCDWARRREVFYLLDYITLLRILKYGDLEKIRTKI